MSDLYTGDYYITDGLDPNGIARVYGGARTAKASEKECSLALNEYLAGTRRWNHWLEWVNNGFTFATEKFYVRNGINCPPGISGEA